MKKIVFLLILLSIPLILSGCDDGEYITVEATITDKVERSGAYFFILSYERENFYEPLTAEEKVSKSVYDKYQINDTYMFKIPVITRSDTEKK